MKKKILFTIITLVIFSILLEFAGRLYLFVKNDFNYSPLISYINSDSLGYTPVPGFSFSYFSIDSLGFRNNGNAVSGGKTILCVGGSTTFGTGNKDNETYPAQLEAILRAKGKNVNVINAGVSGYSSKQLALRHSYIVSLTKPDIVIVNSCWNTGHHVQKYFKNDHLPSYWLFEHSLIFRTLDRLLRKKGWSVHYRSWPDDRELLARQDSLIKSKQVIIDYSKDIERIIAINQKHNLNTIFLNPPSLFYDDNLDSLINRFQESRFGDLDTLFFSIGLNSNLIRDMSWKVLKEADDNNKIFLLDLNPKFKKIKYIERSKYFYDQIHPIADGNAIIAESIAEFIIKNKLI